MTESEMENEIEATETFRLEKKRTIPAPVEEVFQAWTDPEMFTRWFRGPTKHVSSFTNDVRTGGAFEIFLNVGGQPVAIRGEYLEVRPPHRLVFSWNSKITGHANTRVTLDFQARGANTELSLVHEFFQEEALRDRNHGGWNEVLDQLVGMFGG